MKYKLIYIEWLDANDLRSGWTSNSSLDDWVNADQDAGYCKQVGWLVRENEKRIVISSLMAPENDYQDEHFSLLFKIPKTWIRKRKVLKI